MDEKKFKGIVAENIIKLRKMKKITQLELAEHLNYTDKAVSKWEKGESLPDVMVLKQIADYFNVTLDALITDKKEKQYKIGFVQIKKITLIPILSVLIVWIVAIVAFQFFNWLNTPFYANSANGEPKYYLVFVYGVPASLIVLLVFSLRWWNTITTGLISSVLIWTTCLSFHLSIEFLENIWMIYLVGIPLQIAVVLWFFLRPQKRKVKIIK